MAKVNDCVRSARIVISDVLGCAPRKMKRSDGVLITSTAFSRRAAWMARHSRVDSR